MARVNLPYDPTLDRLGGAASSAALRRFRRDLAETQRGSGTPTDVVVIGDSITEGYLSSNDQAFVVRLRQELKRRCGFPAGGIGHRHVNTQEYNTPRFAGTGTTADLAAGASKRGGFVTYSAIQANTYTITTTYDRVIVNYLKANIFGQSKLYISDSSSGVIDSTTSTVDGTLPAFTYRGDAIRDTGALGAAASRTLTLATGTDASFTAGTGYGGAYFLSGEGAGDVRVWNAGRFGITTTQLASDRNYYDLASGLGAALVVIASGTNDPDANTYAQQLAALITNVRATYTAAAKIMPSIVIMPPPPNGTRTAATAANFRGSAYAVAAQYGAAVFDWYNLFGDVSTTGAGDTLTLTADNTHPNDRGHALLGYGLASFLLDGRN